MTLTAKVIGADGKMGREHVAAYRECGVKIVDVRPDIVSIASPDNTHGEYVIDALKHGCHVFCEKPLATDHRDLEEIVNLRGDRAIWQNFPLRYQPIFKMLKDKMPDFGEIYRIEASYNWGRTYKLYETWRTKDYSLVTGGMIHMIDLVTYLTGYDIIPKSTAGINFSAPGFNGPDTVTALCEMKNGGISVFTVDGGTGVDSHHHRISIHGTKKGITLVNREPTNKRAAIYDFVKTLDEGVSKCIGLTAVAAAIQIRNMVEE
jgi:predicted dehydrogenase